MLMAIEDLRVRLPAKLQPLAPLAMNYRWSWAPDGESVFAEVHPRIWEHCRHNPRELLMLAPVRRLQELAEDRAFVARVEALSQACAADLPTLDPRPVTAERPVAYFCAEFGFHESVPIYSGGLGVLAGDILKAASDLRLPLVAVGLFYKQGYFHQRLDPWGWQHEYWTDLLFDRLPAVRVQSTHGKPLEISVSLRGRTVFAQVWRIDIGRTRLFLLDADHASNHPADRWITARLYVSDRQLRLAQYALLGIGGMRALAAMGIEPAFIHLNEGHAALGAIERLRARIERGASFENALSQTRGETVFTTHTPVPAGNEGYHEHEWQAVLEDYFGEIGVDKEVIFDLGRAHPGNREEPVSITPLALRLAGKAVGVSRKHGAVSRQLWRNLWPDLPVEQVPIGHVTNGVHSLSWMAPPMQSLLRKHLGDDWALHCLEPGVLEQIDQIPDEELWQVRSALRRRLVEYVRAKSVRDRLSRGEDPTYVLAASETFHAEALTIGFARRVVGYKRLYLLARVSENGLLSALDLEKTPLQLILAGKAHPADHEAKEDLRNRFQLKSAREIGRRVVFLEDYDIDMARQIVAGVDLWLNLPRPPLEASGTSGMKVALNGGLNLSVLDGWWDEAYDGHNGWAIRSPDADPHTQDEHDAAELVRLLRDEVIPLFYDRDAVGIPRGWVAKIKRSMRTLIGRYSAHRMVSDYATMLYHS
jgi:starch phosphorylase